MADAIDRHVSARSLLSDPKVPPLTPVCALWKCVGRRNFRNMSRQRPYPSDLSDARWELPKPILSVWRAERRGKGLDIGRPPEHDLRRIMDAVLYVDRTGIPWPYLPHDFAPRETVYGYFAAWQKDGVFDQLNGLLRRLVREPGRRTERVRAGRPERQDLCQRSGRWSGHRRGQEDRSTQAAHRRRHPRPSPRGLGHRGQCLRQRRRHSPALVHRQVTPPNHQGLGRHRLRTKAIDHGVILGIDVEVTRRDPGQKGFKVIPRRRVVERTFGWLMNHRRLARDHETHPHRSEAMIRLAMIDLMSRRLTRESTPNWKDS